ncbi:MAG: WD40 repeat domain-containing protein [Anaerolineae bacterium]|nr:WD40 repeat domain-containing protein [Candidatus Roseilinea sp.]MDW8451562.1 WD40 repeat domain-containing protein [Anaerolineae bacterium]
MTLFDTGSRGNIALINAQSAQVERTIPITRPEKHLLALHFLTNGRLLFSQGEGLAVLDPASGVRDTLSYPSAPARVAVSTNGERLAVLLQDRSIQIASIGQGGVISTSMIEAYRSGNQAVREMAISPAGDRLAVGLAGGVVEIWELSDAPRKQRRVTTGMPEWREIWLGELGLGTRELFLCWPDDYIERWETIGAEDAWRVQRLDHLVQYGDVAFTATPDLLALGESTGVVRLWRMSEGRVIKTIGERFASSNEIREMAHLAISPDGALVAIGLHVVPPNEFNFERSVLSIWDANNGQRLAEFTERGSIFSGLVFSPDGAALAIGLRSIGQEGGVIKLWRAADPRDLQTLERLEGTVAGPVFSPDGRSLIAAHGRSVTIWSTENGRRLDSWTALRQESGKPYSLALLQDGVTLIIATERWVGEMAVLNIARREEQRYIKGGYRFFEIAPSPIAGVPLVAAGTDGPLFLRNLTDDKRSWAVPSPLEVSLHRVAFAPDGRLLVTLSSNGIVTVWGVPPP